MEGEHGYLDEYGYLAIETYYSKAGAFIGGLAAWPGSSGMENMAISIRGERNTGKTNKLNVAVFPGLR